MSWTTLFNENTLDAWISGLGSAIGALAAGVITGLIALRIMKNQFKYEEKKKEEQLKEGFIRTYHSIINSLSLANEIMKILEGIDGYSRMISDEPVQKDKDIKRYLARIERYSADIEKIDEKQIPLNFIKEFYEVKRIISTYSTMYLPPFDRLENLSEEERKKMLNRLEPTIKSKRIESQQKVETFIDKFNEYAEKILNENNKK